MSWIEQTEEFVGKYGFGSRGKHTSVSRILNPTDLTQLQTSQLVCAYRPRGILSGFLVIHPQLQYAVYLPPAASKLQPLRFHLRIDSKHMNIEKGGIIFSAYLYNKQFVIDDLLAIDGYAIWQTRGFIERWARLKRVMETELRHDSYLQNGITITCASYISLNAIVEPPTDTKILEFVPCGNHGGQKHMIWIPERNPLQSLPERSVASDTRHPIHNAKREISMGPDVYTLYDGDKKLGIALIRTLTSSRALRLAFTTPGCETVRVITQFNKQFEKWEVLDVAAPT